MYMAITLYLIWYCLERGDSSDVLRSACGLFLQTASYIAIIKRYWISVSHVLPVSWNSYIFRRFKKLRLNTWVTWPFCLFFMLYLSNIIYMNSFGSCIVICCCFLIYIFFFNSRPVYGQEGQLLFWSCVCMLKVIMMLLPKCKSVHKMKDVVSCH